MPETTIYVASAGTGKTTALLEELTKVLETTTPETVIFTTFTNAGAKEARLRALQKFPQFREKDFRYFRTLHSLAYKNVPYRKMIGFSDYILLANTLNLHINARRGSMDQANAEGIHQGFSLGDKLINLNDHRRSRRWNYETAVQKQEDSSFSVNELKNFHEAFVAFKEEHNVYDFIDLLEQFLLVIEDWTAPLTHLFVDESQDLSTLQWEVVNKLRNKVPATILAGDDKQAIYGFSGADPDKLIHMEGTRIVLSSSYRLPKTLLHFAETVAQRITEKQDYSVTSISDGGEIEYIEMLQQIREPLKHGTWFLLARNKRFLEYYETHLDAMGVLYLSDNHKNPLSPKLVKIIDTWESMIAGYPVSGEVIKLIYKKYLKKNVIRWGFKKQIDLVTDEDEVTYKELEESYGLRVRESWVETFNLPDYIVEMVQEAREQGNLYQLDRIKLGTIHSVKGKEADNVVILPDMSHKTYEHFFKEPDSEHRVFYVGLTRAKKRLYMHQPLTQKYYPL